MIRENGGNRQENLSSFIYSGELIKMVIQGVLGLGLLSGGIVLLTLKIAGWSLIFGLPMVVISCVFIIYTYDDVLSKNLNIQDDINSSERHGTDNVTLSKNEKGTPPNKLV